jgi:hypothetical protein
MAEQFSYRLRPSLSQLSRCMFENEITVLVYSAVNNATCSVGVAGDLINFILQAADSACFDGCHFGLLWKWIFDAGLPIGEY